MTTLPEVSILPIPNRRGCCTSRQNSGEDAQERIQNDALEVLIRCSWHAPGRDSVDVPIEYCILLSRDGPAVRIVGDLNKCGEPVSARIEHQDLFNPFMSWVGNCNSVEKILLAYARCFNFDE